MWSDWLVFCDYGFSVSALWCSLKTPTVLLGFLLPWTWGISSWLLQQSAAAAPYFGWGCPSWPWTWSSSSQPSCAQNTEWSQAKANRVLPRERTGHSKHPLPKTQEKISTHGHQQMVNTEIRLIIFFAPKDGEALYSQQKQDQELTVAQIMNSLLPNSDLNWRK